MPKKLTGKWKSVDTLNVQSDGFQYRLIQVENELFVLGYSDGNKVENIGYGHSDSFDVGSIIEISWVNVPSNFSYIPASHKLKLEIVDENSVSVYEVVSGQNKSYGNWKRV